MTDSLYDRLDGEPAIMAFGGPNNYHGRDMRKAHMRPVENGLTDEHFDRVVTLLAASLQELGVEEALISEVGAATEGLRADVVNR